MAGQVSPPRFIYISITDLHFPEHSPVASHDESFMLRDSVEVDLSVLAYLVDHRW